MKKIMWIVFFAVLGILFAAFGYSGVAIAVAVPFLTKMWFFLAFLCFFIAVLIFVLEKYLTKRKAKKAALEAKPKE